MKKTQIAMRSFEGEDGFVEGLDSLKAACEAARRAIEAADSDWRRMLHAVGSYNSGKSVWEKNQTTEIFFGLALHLQAAHGWIEREKQKCVISAGELSCTTASGLTFGWSRWDTGRGYSFSVRHPSGYFPEGSKLRLALEAAGWHVNTYKNGQFLRTEEPIFVEPAGGAQKNRFRGAELVALLSHYDLRLDQGQGSEWEFIKRVFPILFASDRNLALSVLFGREQPLEDQCFSALFRQFMADCKFSPDAGRLAEFAAGFSADPAE